MDIDETYKEIGEFGPYQKKIFWGFAFFQGTMALHIVHNVYLGAPPNFYCKRSGKAALYNECPKDGAKCDTLEFPGDDFTSVTSEWSLVCQDAYKSDAIQSALMLGILLGSLTCGYLGDKYGRRKIVYMLPSFLGVVTIGGIFAPNVYVYMCLRMLAGVCCGGGGMIGFVLVTEVIGQSKRSFAGMVMPLIFGVGIVVFSVLAFCVREWRSLTVVTALPCLIGVYFYFIMPESPRWLYSHGRYTEAESLLGFFVYRNTGHKPQTGISLRRPDTTRLEEPQPGALDLVRHPMLRSLTINNCFTWFVNCMVYYGLTMSSGNLGANLYMSVALSGAVEIPACLVAYVLMEYAGRRISYSLSMLLGGILCVMLLLLPPEYGTVRVVLAVLGKMGITLSFCVAWLYAAEMYPTNIRNKAISINNMCARLGGIIAPAIITFGKFHQNMDFAIFGLASIIAGIVCLKLPETRGKSMPETIADLDDASSKGQGHLEKGHRVGLEGQPALSEEKLRLLQNEIEGNEDDSAMNI